MNDLNQAIKKSIEKSSVDEANQQTWQNFLDYRDGRSKKKRGFYIPLLTLAILLLFLSNVYLYYRASDIEHKLLKAEIEALPHRTPDYTLPIESPKTIQKRSSSVIEENAPVITQRGLDPIKLNSQATTFRKEPSQVNQIVNASAYNTIYDLTPSESSKSMVNAIPEDVTSKKTTKLVHNLPILGMKPVVYSGLHQLPHQNLTISDVDPLSLNSPYKNPWSLEIRSSIARPVYTNLLNQSAIYLGLAARYTLSDHIDLKAYVDLQKSNLGSNEFIPEIGLKPIETPNPDLMFSEITVKTTAIRVGLGFDYVKPITDRLSLRLGPSLGLIKELSKDLEYQFEGEQDNQMEDDDVNISEDSLELFPILYKLNGGVEYKIWNNISGNLTLSYQDQILKNKLKSPHEYGLQIGLVKKL